LELTDHRIAISMCTNRVLDASICSYRVGKVSCSLLLLLTHDHQQLFLFIYYQCDEVYWPSWWVM
jgi:hypothetical protein